MQKFGGILSAAVTPFDAEDRFVASSFEKVLARAYAAGCDGVYVCGSTGEGTLQPPAQRKLVTEVAVQNRPKGKIVMVHTGAASTAEAVELTRHAAAAGADAVSAIAPSGPYSFAEVKSYYEAIAAASSVPLFVYYFPEFAPAISTPEQVEELLTIPNVAGVKFTNFNFYTLSNLIRAGYTVYNGRDEALACGLLMGAQGGIGTFYNLVPELFVAVYQHAQRGEWAQARQVQERINDLIRLSLRYPLFPATKQMLTWAGIACGGCLGPRRGLTPGEREGLRKDLLAAGFAELAG